MIDMEKAPQILGGIIGGGLASAAVGAIVWKIGVEAGIFKDLPETTTDVLVKTAVHQGAGVVGALGASALMRSQEWDLPAASSDAVAILSGAGAVTTGLLAVSLPPEPLVQRRVQVVR